ncbi:MAG: nucleoid-associated protein [Bacteroidota bacterium]|nr:nucleoid-associated protein [Bacteroidota bacterium]
MLVFDDILFKHITIHRIGNKLFDEGIRYSKSCININSEISSLLSRFFLSPFKNRDYFNLFHESDLLLNEIYSYTTKIFENPDELYNQSIHIAKHLYEKSAHPKIKAGELYVVYFKDCVVEDEVVDAVGLFKSESKETYLRVYPSGDNFEINSENGININKLDKGCLIFNTEKERGYLVCAIDSLNRGTEAKYWMDDFLRIRFRDDEFFQTGNLMSMCQSFVAQVPDVEKKEKVEIMKKAVNFLKENDKVEFDDFAGQLLQEAQMRKAFVEHKRTFEKERNVVIPDKITVSNEAVKKEAKKVKNVIILDNNYRITIDGSTEYIEKGFDPYKEMSFYKLYFNEEK